MKSRFFLSFVLVSSVILNGFSQWNVDPSTNTSVCLALNDQQDVRIVSDSKGGAIIGWVDFRNDPLVSDIFVQRINSNGIVLWSTNGLSICTNSGEQTSVSLTETGKGSVILVWQDLRNGNRDIYAQKIDSSGVIQWTAGGVPVCVKAENQSSPKIIPDGVGGAIVSWEDSIGGSMDIYAQRLSSTGIQLWNTSGVIICSASFSQINPRIETDDAGGAIIVWQDKRNGVDYDIYAQRIDSSGALKWAVNGIAIASIAGTQSNPKIEPDHTGGVIIAWQDKRNGNDYNIYTQRINSSGAIQWATNGIAVCSQIGTQSAIDMTSEGVNGAIITWKDSRNGNFDIYYQMVNLSGTMQYTLGGNAMSLLSNDQLNPSIAGDGSGGAIIVWQDSSTGNWNVQSGKINSTGIIQWKEPVGTAIGNQTNPKNVSDGNGGVIIAWQDKRNSSNKFDIYAHRILSGGVSASIYESDENRLLSVIYPNPFSHHATIKIENNSIDFTLTVYDIFGKEINIDKIHKSDGIDIYRGELASGIYIYKITQKKIVPINGYFIITH